MTSRKNLKKGVIKPKRKIMKKPVSPALKTYISKAMAKGSETKIQSTEYTLTSFNSAIGSSPDIIECFPNITQGVAQNNRIGNKIKPIRLEIIGYIIYLTDQKTDARLIGARLMCYQDKQIRCYTNTQLNYNLLNSGGTPVSYTGTAMNYIMPHNKDNFTFYSDKRFKILKPFGLSNLAVPSASLSLTEVNNTLYQPFKIILTEKHMPNIIQYDQTESTVHPINFAPKISFGYSDLLNFAPDTISLQLAMSFCSTLYYKDV